MNDIPQWQRELLDTLPRPLAIAFIVIEPYAQLIGLGLMATIPPLMIEMRQAYLDQCYDFGTWAVFYIAILVAWIITLSIIIGIVRAGAWFIDEFFLMDAVLPIREKKSDE